MKPGISSGTLGVVVVHQPASPVGYLPAVRDLVDQVDELVLVLNGSDELTALLTDERVGYLKFPTNRGTAVAWNAALALAAERGRRFLYLLDQDSTPHPHAVATALAQLGVSGAAAVVQPARRDRLGLDPFPWNTVASGSVFEVAALQQVGGFDKRLFVDEVDHELLARLMTAGFRVEQLAAPTIDHVTGTPRPIAFLGQSAVVSGHSPERRRMQGYSAGILIRRYLRYAPATSGRLLARHTLTAGKDLVAGNRSSAGRLVAGLVAGFTAGRPPWFA